MGLDMYLTASRYLSGDKELKLKKTIKKTFGVTEYEPEDVTFRVGYWRKANQIHKWFVDNVQDGNDDCGIHYVSQEKLQELLKLVNNALVAKNPSKILPTQEGFFFGGCDYDSNYYNDLKETKNIIKNIMRWKMKDKVDFYYHSSW